MPGKRMVIKLTQDERPMLETYVSQGHKNARDIHRARLLLLSNDGRKVQDIAQVLGVSQATISHVRKQYYPKEHEHPLDFFKDAPCSGRPISLDRQVEAHVTMMACSQPPAGSARWPFHRMADTLLKLDGVETIAHASVRRIFKKTNCSRGEAHKGG